FAKVTSQVFRPDIWWTAYCERSSLFLKGCLIDVISGLKRPAPGDGGVDIIGNFLRIPFVIQCKNQRRGIGPSVVRELEGVLTKYHEDTIGILMVPTKNKFNDGAVERARASEYILILTDARDLYSDLVR
ncbi:2750_t:CDS:2, partial [Acaulospora colombiana]